ncbi:glycoside hydrolase family 55 protein [Tunturibacter empetritectus]|nr:glycoside hydrolase family 55 protein [Edaphobacter lichenicola]
MRICPPPPRNAGISLLSEVFRCRALLRTSISVLSLLCILIMVGCSGQTIPITEGGTAAPQPLSLSGATLSGTLTFPTGFMTSVKSYGAVGDGVTDDTAAIQSALSDGRSNAAGDYNGLPKALYFPPGTYLVSNTLQWNGCCVTLQGSGSSSSIIRLAPSSSGFNNSSAPKPLIQTPKGNQSFRQSIWDLGFSVGSGNSGATALSYVSNNVGSIHDVLIKSEDGTGHAGIDLTRQWAGPMMIRNTEVQGFDVGIDLKNAEYSITMEGITLQNQNIAGIRNSNQAISVRGLTSTNKVPALTNAGGFVILLDGSLSGGVDTVPAIQTNSNLFLRNVSSSGYEATLQDSSTSTPTLTKGTISHLLVGTPSTLTGTINTIGLNLSVQETPSFTSSSLTDWAVFTPKWYGDTSGLQAVLNSGKHTVYFPFGQYFSSNETDVTVPDTVDRIVGFSSVVNLGSGTNGGGIRFVVTSNATQPLIIEQFGYGIKIDHRGSRPIVLKDAHINNYAAYAGAGKLFLEDIGISGLTVQKGQQVWARQLDNELNGTKISNLGASLWIFGLKTEAAGTVINTTSGGKTELLGSLIYPSTSVPTSQAAFISTDAQVSYMYKESVYCSGCGYAIQVQETRSGVTKSITSPNSNPFRMPLFIGYK